MRLLLIEDHQDIADNVCEYFTERNHAIEHVADGESGLRLLRERQYDVVVLDLMLPGLDGLGVCRALRNELKSRTPVLILTAKDRVVDKVTGFGAGADDYLVKPFSLLELEARLTSLARRASPLEALRVAGLTYDPRTLTARRDGAIVRLNPSTRCLLILLMHNSHRVVARGELAHELWGDQPPDGGVLRAHMYALRTVIDKPFRQKLIHTYHGEGYRLAAIDNDEPEPA